MPFPASRWLRIPCWGIAGLLLSEAAVGPVLAQAPVSTPNPMAAHTVFIILIVAAFLAWAVSFSMRIMKERSRHLDRRSLDRQKEAVLDRIAALEVARESGAVPESRYSLEMKHLRGELARVLDHIRRAARPSPEKSRTAGDKRRA